MADEAYYFDDEAAEHVCRFCETQIHHWKGEHAGELWQLLDWQRHALRNCSAGSVPPTTRGDTGSRT